MLQIATIIAVILALLGFIFVLAMFPIIWFRERNLPPEEKERRRAMRSGGISKKQTSVLLIVRLAVFGLLAGIVVVSLFGAKEKYNQQFNSQEISQVQQSKNQPIKNDAIDTFDSTLRQDEEWQTYRNSEFGFEFKYPNNEWILLQTDSNALPFLRRIKAQDSPVSQIWFDVFTVPEDGQSLEDIIVQKTALGESGINIGSIEAFEERMHGTNHSYYINDYLFEGQYRVTYYLDDNNKVVRFNLGEFTSMASWTDPDWIADKEPNHSMLKEILATFRFVE